MGGGTGSHSVIPTLGPIDGAHAKVFPEHPQGGGHVPRYRAFRFENHERSSFRFGAITAVGEAEQARWLARMMDNPFFPKDTIVHFTNLRLPMVTTPNHLTCHVGQSKMSGTGHLHKHGVKPWYTVPNFFRYTIPTYSAAGFVVACCAVGVLRPQWRMLKKNANKRWGLTLPVEKEHVFSKGTWKLGKPE